MERRKAKVNISSAGGTAGKGAKTYKVTLPTTWVERLGITKEHRELDLVFDGRRITLTQYLSGSEFAKRQRAQGHAVRAFRLYDGDQLCTTIYADFTERSVMAENQAVPPIKTAFGNNPIPTWEDFQRFLEERCIPRQRAGLREYLETLGLDEYDPLAIIEKTSGRMAEDQQWLSIEVLK
ncbi:MAG: hypothetical protein K2L38_09835 [Dysosmobacter sp.]|nr:hypothetical protein [Dysosmobacter sp.]